MLKRFLILLLALAMLASPVTAFAEENAEGESTSSVSEASEEEPAEEETTAPKKEKPKGKWKTKKHYTYYYIGKKPAKGLTEIGKKTYYFDKKGKQRTGWQKIGKKYYFFKIANGKKGYMVKGKKINKIYLKKNGRAKVTDANKKRLKTLVYATELVEMATKPDMKKSEKLRAVYDYMLAHYKYRGSPKFRHTKNWEVDYAYFMYTQLHGSCFHYGATFAFAANACGYKECYAVSSGGHGWAQVDGRVTDVSWERVDRNNHYFHFDINLSGRNGRPNYKRYGCYKKRI